MNGFEMHGIGHLSPSSLNLWAAQPALWVMERLLKHRAPVGCAAHRGTAIEAGVTEGLLRPDAPVEICQRVALTRYDQISALSADPRRAKQREGIPASVAVALGELRQYGVPDLVQAKVVHRLPDVPVEVLGFLDFGWSEHGVIVDLKTADRLASEISPAHARQGALYVHNSNREMRFAYTTPAKIGVYRLEHQSEHIGALRQIALRLEKFLRISKDAQELAGLMCPDFSSFYWSDPTARAKGREVFGF